MTITYASFEQFTQQYSLRDITAAEVNSVWLPYGARRVNEALGRSFTTPFSDNNATARQLSIDFGAYGLLLRTRKPDDSDELGDDLKTRVADIMSGHAPMIDDSGGQMFAGGGGFDSALSTGTEKPIFDTREPIEQRVDPDQLRRLRDEDS